MFRMSNQLVAVLLVASLIPATSVSAQQDRDFSELEKVALAELRETGTPGAAIIIVSGDRAVFVKGFGVASIETGIPFTTDTLFRISNISKFLTATVLLSLADEGKVDLNAPIGRYVNGLSPKLSRVTARQLLNETSGVKELHLQLGLYDDAALGNIVRSWKDDWVFAKPESIYSASHPGYAVAGLLIEEVAGKPFADVMTEKLLRPLGMSRSTCRPLVMVTYPFSQGHWVTSGQKPTVVRPFASDSVGWPSEAVFSSANDLSRFLITFLNGGKLDGRQVIAPSVIATLSKPHAAGPAVIEGEVRHGLSSASYGNHHVLRGNFSWGGMRSQIRIAPNERFAAIILSNGSPPAKTMQKALEMFLGPPLPSGATEPLPMTQAEMSRYVGTYANERVLTLLIKEKKLFVRDDSPDSLVRFSKREEHPVTKVGENRFSIAAWSESFTFVTRRDGKIEYLHYGARALKRR